MSQVSALRVGIDEVGYGEGRGWQFRVVELGEDGVFGVVRDRRSVR